MVVLYVWRYSGRDRDLQSKTTSRAIVCPQVLYAAIDYLKYSQLEGEESKCRHLEAFLCKTCASLSDHPEGRRLIGHLTRTLAVVKLCAGDLAQSIEFSK